MKTFGRSIALAVFALAFGATQASAQVVTMATGAQGSLARERTWHSELSDLLLTLCPHPMRQGAAATTAQGLLDSILAVELAEGKWKYVQIELTAPGGTFVSARRPSLMGRASHASLAPPSTLTARGWGSFVKP